MKSKLALHHWEMWRSAASRKLVTDRNLWGYTSSFKDKLVAELSKK